MTDIPIKQRKIYEINELLQKGDKKLTDLYLAIKSASDYAYENCDVRIPLNYDVFNEIEKNAIKLEKSMAEEKVKNFEDTLKSINQTKNISNIDYIKYNINSEINDRKIDNMLQQIKDKWIILNQYNYKIFGLFR